MTIFWVIGGDCDNILGDWGWLLGDWGWLHVLVKPDQYPDSCMKGGLKTFGDHSKDLPVFVIFLKPNRVLGGFIQSIINVFYGAYMYFIKINEQCCNLRFQSFTSLIAIYHFCKNFLTSCMWVRIAEGDLVILEFIILLLMSRTSTLYSAIINKPVQINRNG